MLIIDQLLNVLFVLIFWSELLQFVSLSFFLFFFFNL